jgi:predicted GIY-YIG superfamily endonuclease
MADLPKNVPNIWLRSFYGFGPEEDGYIGWTKEAGRDHMLKKIQDGDLILVYGAASNETKKSQRLRILGFLQVDAIPILDVEKASETGMRRKTENGWQDKWTYGLPVRRAWRADENVLLERIAPTTYRPESGQSIAAWSSAIEDHEIQQALKIKVTEVSVFGEPSLSDEAISNEPFAEVFKPSRAFPGGPGERTSVYEDGDTFVYLARFDGDGHALLGKDKPIGDKSVVMKIGVSNDTKRRLEELNSGIPPAALGKWKIELQSQPHPNKAAAERAEQQFKDKSERKLDSLGKEFFWGNWTTAITLFAALPGTSRF